MNIFGIIEINWAKNKQEEFDDLCIKLNDFGYRAVKITTDKTKKQASAKKATEARQSVTREKIQNGLNLWRIEGNQDKDLTPYRLGKLAGVSTNTAKKYLEEMGVVLKKRIKVPTLSDDDL